MPDIDNELDDEGDIGQPDVWVVCLLVLALAALVAWMFLGVAMKETGF